MVLTDDLNLPSDEELTVPQEITLSTPWFKAVSVYMAKECEEKIKHFMLLRRENQDPRKTLNEGAEVTACGVDFLKKLKKTCNDEVSELANCLDQASNKMYLTSCRDEQRYLDRCVEEKHGMERPKMGYFSRLHIHDPGQPKPIKPQRDYQAEASKLMDELPENYVIPKNYMKYNDYKFNWFKKWGSN